MKHSGEKNCLQNKSLMASRESDVIG
jgi:hypothetical protein